MLGPTAQGPLQHTTGVGVGPRDWAGGAASDGTGEPGALPRVVAIVAGVVVAFVLVLSFVVLIGGYRGCPASSTARWAPASAPSSSPPMTRNGPRRSGPGRYGEACRRRRPPRPSPMARPLGRGRPGRRGRPDRAPAALPHLPARRRGRGGAGPARPHRADRPGRGRRRDLDKAFGPQRVGGFAPGGITSGHMPGSAHYEGRAVDVFFRPVTKRNRAKGWAMAQYLVAHADRLAVNTVIFDGWIWTHRGRSRAGGSTTSTPPAGRRRWPRSSSTATTCTSTWPTDPSS